MHEFFEKYKDKMIHKYGEKHALDMIHDEIACAIAECEKGNDYTSRLTTACSMMHDFMGIKGIDIPDL